MAHQYGQYCPLALAVELLCERWTLLVVSRLIDGCKQFNEIHRGVPRISPTPTGPERTTSCSSALNAMTTYPWLSPAK